MAKNTELWNELMAKSPANYDLRHIIEYCDEQYKGMAWEQLLKQSPANDDLTYIMVYCDELYKGMAQKLLDEREQKQKIRTKTDIINMMKGD